MFCSVVQGVLQHPAKSRDLGAHYAIISKHPCPLAANVLDFKNNNQADVFTNLKKAFRL